MQTIHDLIERCGKNDATAWAELCLIVLDTVERPLRKMVEHCGADLSFVDDIQDLYSGLLDRKQRALRAFHGSTEQKLRGYLQTMASRLARRLLQNRRTEQSRGAAARRHARQPDRSGPTEEQCLARLREIEALMMKQERARPRAVLIWKGFLPGSERTEADVQVHDERTRLSASIAELALFRPAEAIKGPEAEVLQVEHAEGTPQDATQSRVEPFRTTVAPTGHEVRLCSIMGD